MAAHVLRVVLDDFSSQNDAAHLSHTNHSIGARHLPDSVGKEKQFLPGGSVDQDRDFAH
jgi:hypothetical protein